MTDMIEKMIEASRQHWDTEKGARAALRAIIPPELVKLAGEATAGPWYPGAQNDALFIIAGRAPALNNDYPWHDAPRVALAKMYGPTPGDCLPVNADANARYLAAAVNFVRSLIEETEAKDG